MKECWINVYLPEYPHKYCHQTKSEAVNTSLGMNYIYNRLTIYRIHVKMK